MGAKRKATTKQTSIMRGQILTEIPAVRVMPGITQEQTLTEITAARVVPGFCRVWGCERPTKQRELCAVHYEQDLKYREDRGLVPRE